MNAILNNIYFLVLAVGVSSAVGDLLVNQYVKSDQLKFFLLGCLGWSVAAAFWSQILRQQAFAPSVALFFIGNVVVAAIVGYFYFNDQVPVAQWLWILVAVIALVFIVRG